MDDGVEGRELVPFSHRYGLRAHAIGESIIGSRHGSRVWPDGCSPSQCEADERFQCACPGGHSLRRCCQRATAEDRLCNACRDWCWATDGVNPSVRIIDAFPVAV